jgi:type I restriction enzyme S subunit
VKPYPDYKPSGVAWLGDVPGHWDVDRLRFHVRLNPAMTVPLEQTDFVSFLPMDAIGDDGSLSLEHMRQVSEVASGYTYFEEGDVTIAKITPCFENGKGAVMQGLHQGAGFGTTELIVMRPSNSVVPHWLYFLTMCQVFRDPGEAMMLGAGGQKRVPDLFVKDYRAAFPSSDEQQAIADYLDTETARIDALIREKLGLIGLLGEFRQSVIADLTTGANLTVPKTQTDNVFCPSIPSEWQMVRLGKYARIGNGSTPLKDNADYWVGGTFPWLNSAVVNQDEVFEGSELVTDEALRACHLPIVQAGAVLIALTGQGKTRGQVTVLRITATINQHLAYLTAESSAFATEYLFWTLTGTYAALRMVSDGQGGTKGALTCEDLSRFQIPKPPLAEQQAIAVQVKTETARIDALIHHAKEEIALLKELRAATIADAVLGRVDVRRSS